MSWFARSGPLRTSLRAKSSPSPSKELDANACYESFKMHWQQAWEIIGKQGSQVKNSRADSINAVLNHIDQMVTLLLHDLRVPGNTMGPILDYLLTEDILNKLFSWSKKTGEYLNALKLEQLKLYEVLISNSQQELLVHKPILQPLLKLLSFCSECAPVEVEKRLVILLNQLCVSLTQNTSLIEFFFSLSSIQGPARFLIFSLLIPFVHRDGGIGQQARDALLLCMSLSRKHENIGLYIAENSNFCPILATGLSGLYSLLPRKLSIEAEDWHRFTVEDVNDIPELSMFLNSLEFCNAVIQVSFPLVQEQLLEYLYQGFLVPVLGPALHQTSVDEIIAATAYLDLFLRTITEPALLKAFLKFILTESYENNLIVDSLIARIGTQSRLCLVTLALFKTLLDLNCEDVMLHLVFRYLIPCTHVMVSQRCRVRDLDIYSKTAEKFLSLIPSCCLPDECQDAAENQTLDPYSFNKETYGHTRSHTVSEGNLQGLISTRPGVPQTSYLDYLVDARKGVKSCFLACKSWTHCYDGERSQLDALSQNSETVKNILDTHRKTSSKFSSNIASNSKAQIVLFPRNSIDDISVYNTNQEPCVNMSNGLPENKDDSVNNGAKNYNSHINDCETFAIEDSCETFSEANKVKKESSTKEVNDTSHWKMEDCQIFPEEQLNEKCLEIDSSSRNSIKDRLDPDPIHPTDEDENEMELDDLVKKAVTDQTANSECEDFRNLNSIQNSCYAVDADIQLCTKTPSPHSSAESFGSPDIGAFLSMLLTKLENMMHNNLYINLQLTSLITRLAYYPQPLLRSFLLNHTLVFQPTVKSLLQVLGSLKHKLDSYASTIDNFGELLFRARKFLAARDERLMLDNGYYRSPERSRRSSSPDSHKAEIKRRSLTDILFRRQAITGDKDKSPVKEIILEGIPDGTGYRYINRPFPDAPDGKLESLKTKNAVLCAVVLEEFLKELAAVTQEHSVVQEEEFDFDLL